MPPRLAAAALASVYLFFGVCGFIPAFVTLPYERLRYFHDLNIVGQFGFTFGWLARNIPHDVLYIVTGLTGLVAARRFTSAILYLRTLLVLSLSLAVLGVLPFSIDRVFGLLPLFNWNIPVHVITAVFAFYYGLIYPLEVALNSRPNSVSFNESRP